MLTMIVGVVVLLGGLIFFHEFGHYSVAKFFGVKVEVFSLGFGKKIWSKKIGETEYCLSIFPMGGYVKMMGDDPYKEVPADLAHRAFSTQKLYKRFAIVAAGPLANLLLAFVLYTFIFWAGKPYLARQVGTVVVDSPAWEAGIRPGDRLVSIFGQKIEHWSEYQDIVKDKAGETGTLEVMRDKVPLQIPVLISKVDTKNLYGETVQVGGIQGIDPSARASSIAVSDPRSPAGQAGLVTGDLVYKVGVTLVSSYEDLAEAVEKNWEPLAPLTLSVRRQKEGEVQEDDVVVTIPERTLVQIQSKEMSPLGQLGIYPSETAVKSIAPDSPAQKAGLQVNDRIVSINEKEIFNFETIVQVVGQRGKLGQPVELLVERKGESLRLEMTPKETTVEDPITHQQINRYLIGFSPFTVLEAPETVRISIREPGKLIQQAWNETWFWSEHMLFSLVKLATGQISVKNLGGPVMIAQVAGKSLDKGIIEFLQMMCLISLNLFILNLFPIPILDGGHLLFFIIEAIKGKPVSIRTMELANQVGLVFILGLVALTLFLDISKLSQ